ncbi:MAG TPA: hypothetical protein VM468_05950 [Mycoplana sp.]|jgi:multisubunit Na+/H+ antiporter MnhC subunit|nr:hypothetical protein [Mycoplana sp.]
MENFLALFAIVLGSAVLGLFLAFGMRRQRETHRPPHHDEASPHF